MQKRDVIINIIITMVVLTHTQVVVTVTRRERQTHSQAERLAILKVKQKYLANLLIEGKFGSK